VLKIQRDVNGDHG